MKLIDLLVQELPKRGGWPDRSMRCMQTDDSFIRFPDIGDHCDFFANCIADVNRIATREQYEAALAASQKVEWDGAGLPPLGTECEWLDKNTQKWFPVLIKYQSSWVIIIQEIKEGEENPVELSIDVFTEKERCNFRPTRSEADKKRDETAKALVYYLDKETDIDNVFSVKDVIGFYDAVAAGKIPHIRIE